MYSFNFYSILLNFFHFKLEQRLQNNIVHGCMVCVLEFIISHKILNQIQFTQILF